jgi:hypothetical protein
MSDPAIQPVPPEQVKKTWLTTLTTDEWAVALALVIAALVKLGWLHGLQW